MKMQTGTIYFDGLCLVCSAEINHYRRLPGSENFQFLDITAVGFRAEEHGIDPQKVHKVMHVKNANGELYEGVDAFRTIWREIPRYQFLYRLSEGKLIRWLLDFGYSAFIRIRPYLPRKKADCSDSPYCEIKK